MSTQQSTQQRANMVEGQLRPNRVNQPHLLARFGKVAREAFVSPQAQASAYLDQPAPLGQGREAYSPLVEAHLIQALKLQPSDNVLVTAAGAGYGAAIVAGLVESVVAVEDDSTLTPQAIRSFKAERLSNVTVIHASPTTGHAARAPYNAILIDAPFATLPAELVNQLAEGGRLAGVRVNSLGIPEATIYTKHGKTLLEEVLFETKGTVHPAFTVEEKFVF